MQDFTPGELEIMRVLWEHGELNPPEIQARFPRSISNMALRAALKVLVEKGHVQRRKRGRAYFYRALTRRDRTLRRMTRYMAQVFTGGSNPRLIAHMIKSQDLSEADVEMLREIISKSSSPPKQ